MNACVLPPPKPKSSLIVLPLCLTILPSCDMSSLILFLFSLWEIKAKFLKMYYVCVCVPR